MGACLSLPIPWDQGMSCVCDILRGEGRYVCNLEENLEALEGGMERLKRMQIDVQNCLDHEGSRGFQQPETVLGWLKDVEAIETDVNELLDDKVAQLEKLCLWGYFSKDFPSTRDYGRRLFQIRGRVEALEAAKVLENVKKIAIPTPVVHRPIRPTVGLEPTLENAWNKLMDHKINILGLYGMGGVGKTTLLARMNNMFLEARYGFDRVIWVLVSRNLQIESIQEDIWGELNDCDKEWKQKRRDQKASDIYNFLRRKKFVLLLDDVWEEVPLAEIGVPYPDKNNGCKVAFTTRSREVCGRMEVDGEMEVKCLAEDDAWELFRKKVSENTLNCHPDIPKLARAVAKKCDGLPLALDIIGKTMARKQTVQEWQHAVDSMGLAAREFTGMEKILTILKYSYDSLEGDKIKSSFLYCALFPEGTEIDILGLIDFLLGEGIIDGSTDWDRVKNEGYKVIGILVHASLLMENGIRDSVKMHDVVREMALWIASNSGKQKENFIVKTGGQLRQIPNVEDWRAATKMSLINNYIENLSDSPNCPTLSTLLVKNINLKNISEKFFSLMPNLVVLDLSENYALKVLPEEISKLVSLQYLNLSATGIKQLPVNLKELRKLIYLNLSHSRIQSIDGISSLSKMQVLRLYGCRVSLTLGVLEELQLLEHLKVLTVTIKDGDALVQFLGTRRLASVTRLVSLQWLKLPSNEISLATLDGLEELLIELSDISEIKADWGREMISHLRDGASPSYSPCFRSLSSVRINNCEKLRDLTWLLFAPNLAYLRVATSWKIEEIISRENANGATDGQPSTMPFQRLKSLVLEVLPELKSIYWNPLPVPCLVEVLIIGCPKLKKLPLNSESAKGCLVSINASEEWKRGVEWEDDATKERFFKG